jgi:hypothetical protein
VYPGAAVLRTWRTESPYEWVGYYLVAPCQKGTTWVGRRQEIHALGWGTAVLFIGEQDWPVTAPDSGSSRSTRGAADSVTATAPRSAAPPADTLTGGKQCTAANLSESRGIADALRAQRAAAAEGFPEGSTVYLDVERVEDVSDRLAEYVTAWVREMYSTKKYLPGIYAHERNAAALNEILATESRAAGRSADPPFWVAARTGFDTAAAPSKSGFTFGTLWQGAFNVTETWGGVSLTIDANVARTADPSAPPR